MEFKKEFYKDIEVTYEIDERGKFRCSALGIFGTHNPKDFRGYYDAMIDAEKEIHALIDEFLSNTPKNYKELAEEITSTLVWTGYEECHADEFIIKTIVENFMTYINNKK